MHTNIVKKIKRLRKERGFSTLDMSERLNIDVSAYTRLESGKTFTWAKYLEDILAVFKVDVEDFFKGIESKSNIKNNRGSFGSGTMNIENMYTGNKDNIIKIEELYSARIKDKDEIIAQLQKIIDKMSS